MGPIERELRELKPWAPSGRFRFVDLTTLSEEAFRVVMDARDSLGITLLTIRESQIPDAISAAIEAAATLKL